eukprot:TRINITY_DN843_c0_g1_i1.p1 TRINITY_DN843_c0_g1~~TRINITY_DN843_c0_g1_i1.p1  ORF type:complete len:202 (-),score=57.31 TRINITY_DN843_c0_g1_i1:541-1146(-)
MESTTILGISFENSKSGRRRTGKTQIATIIGLRVIKCVLILANGSSMGLACFKKTGSGERRHPDMVVERRKGTGQWKVKMMVSREIQKLWEKLHGMLPKMEEGNDIQPQQPQQLQLPQAQYNDEQHQEDAMMKREDEKQPALATHPEQAKVELHAPYNDDYDDNNAGVFSCVDSPPPQPIVEHHDNDNEDVQDIFLTTSSN